MVTACTCHDPRVFGHRAQCESGLGPVMAGGYGRDGLYYGPEYSEVYARLHSGEYVPSTVSAYYRRVMAAAAEWGLG
jgi:hypothetical protein